MKKRILAVLLSVGVIGLSLIGCGGKETPAESKEGSAGTEATSNGSSAGTDESKDSTSAEGLSVCFVVTGQLGDKSFNDSAASGVKEIGTKLGYETKIIEVGRDQTKWEPTFMDLAEEGKYDIIITNGSNAGELITTIAPEFPDQKFVIFDTELENGKFPNVYATSYKQNEGSYVAGVLAAMVTTSSMEYANEEKKIGFVGGEEHPIISDFLVGYIEGAKSVDEEIKVYVSYIGSWDDTAKGKEVALAQYNQGVDIIFPAAEQAGLGCIDAAVEQEKYIIGVDSDQALLFKGVDEAKANVILTSVLKEVGASLVRTVEKHVDGSLPWGEYESLGIPEGGVGIAKNEYYEKNIPDDIKKAVEKAEEEVVGGNIIVTSALSGDNDKVQEIIDSVAP